MARVVGPAPSIRIEPRVLPRTLPRSVVDMLALPERDFRRVAAALEADARFQSLVERGLVERVAFRGRIPRHRYEDFMDQELVRVVREFHLEEKPEWTRDFFADEALAGRHRLARAYGVPVGRLLPVLRYCRYLAKAGSAVSADPAFASPSSSPPFSSSSPSSDPLSRIPAPPAAGGEAELIERIRAAVSRWGLGLDEFRRLVMSGTADDVEVAGRVGVSLPEARAVRLMVERLQMLSAMTVEMVAAPGSSRRAREQPLAEFVREDDLRVGVRFIADALYDVKYRIAVDAATKVPRADAEFLDRLRAVNQRKNVLARVVLELLERQYAFLVSGDPLDMRPLTQAAVAGALHEEEAAVSRVVRDKFVRLPEGAIVPLRSLFRRVGDTVRDLVLVHERREVEAGRRDRPFTDLELQKILAERYGVRLARRSVTYHRNRAMKGTNFYARRQRLAGPEQGDDEH